MQGWLKLHRKLQESPLFQDPYIFKLWALCLMKATHKPTSVLVDRQMVYLQPGQFVTGRKALCEEFNRGAKPSHQIKETTLWSWFKRLEEWGNLDIKTNNKYSVVTVVKWDLYQGGGTEIDNEFDNKLTADCPQTDSNLTADCPQTDTNKNVKNLENEKKEDLQQPQQPRAPEPDRDYSTHNAFQQEWGRPLSGMEIDRINSWLDVEGYSPAIIIRALKEAVECSKLTFRYIDGILIAWHKKGWTTPDHVDAGRRSEKQQQEQRQQQRKGGFQVIKGGAPEPNEKYAGFYDALNGNREVSPAKEDHLQPQPIDQRARETANQVWRQVLQGLEGKIAASSYHDLSELVKPVQFAGNTLTLHTTSQRLYSYTPAIESEVRKNMQSGYCQVRWVSGTEVQHG